MASMINIKELMAKKATPTDVNALLKMAISDEPVWETVEKLMQGQSHNGNAKMDGLDAVNVILSYSANSDNPILHQMVVDGHITKNDLFIKLSRVLRSLSIKVKNGRIAGLLTADEIDIENVENYED